MLSYLVLYACILFKESLYPSVARFIVFNVNFFLPIYNFFLHQAKLMEEWICFWKSYFFSVCYSPGDLNNFAYITFKYTLVEDGPTVRLKAW